MAGHGSTPGFTTPVKATRRLLIAFLLIALLDDTVDHADSRRRHRRRRPVDPREAGRPSKVLPFRLRDVQLLPGPFRDAQDIGAKYLLSLEPDRFLARFRSEAGLAPKAEHYPGWEQQGVSVHSAGHYLSACAIASASTGDPRFAERVNYLVAELAACQRANSNGYLAAIPDGRRVFAEVAAGNIRSAGFDLNGCWVPNYTLHKLMAGLRDACGSATTPRRLRSSGDSPTGSSPSTARSPMSRCRRSYGPRARRDQRDLRRPVRRHRRAPLPRAVPQVPSQGRARTAGPR